MDRHSGSLSALQFLLTLALAWLAGAWRFLRQRPKLIVNVMPGPTFSTIIPVEDTYLGNPAHRNVICLYLTILNRGSAGGAIDKIKVSFRRAPTSSKDFFNSRWVSIAETVALDDFRVDIGERTKIFPFLRQASRLTESNRSGYLRVGAALKGTAYFEEENLSYGSHRPVTKGGHTRVKLTLTDTFGCVSHHLLTIPELPIEAARKYGMHIGETFASLRPKQPT